MNSYEEKKLDGWEVCGWGRIADARRFSEIIMDCLCLSYDSGFWSLGQTGTIRLRFVFAL